MNDKTQQGGPRHSPHRQGGGVAVESGRPQTRAPTHAPTRAPTHAPTPASANEPMSLRPALALPERKYFKIGEVAELVGVEPHVLRYWETQFSQLRPHKARSGHRLYRRREVETLLVIKDLLHIQRFTIAGARQALRQQGTTSLLPRAADSVIGESVVGESSIFESVIPVPSPRARQLSLPPAPARAATRAARVERPVVVEEADDDVNDGNERDEDQDIDDDEVELHLAGPMLRHVDHSEIEVEARDGEELEDAMAEQLTSQHARRGIARLEVQARTGLPVAVHSSSGRSARSSAPSSAVARKLLLEAARDLELVLQKLKR